MKTENISDIQKYPNLNSTNLLLSYLNFCTLTVPTHQNKKERYRKRSTRVDNFVKLTIFKQNFFPLQKKVG